MTNNLQDVTERYYAAVQQCQLARQLTYPFSADMDFINNEFKEARAALYAELEKIPTRRKPLIDLATNKNILDLWESLIFHITLANKDEHPDYYERLVIDYKAIRNGLCKAIGLPTRPT